MKRIFKLLVGVALSAVGLSSFAYNGGYENGLMSATTVGGVTYKGYGNNTVTAREAGDTGATIAANRYAQCKALKSINLTGVTTIGDAAFAYSALTSVEIPSTVTKMGFIAFGGCANLASVKVGNWSWYDANKEPFRDCPSLVTLTVPGGVPTGVDVMALIPALKTVVAPASDVAAWQSACPGVTVKPAVQQTFGIQYDLTGGVAGEKAPVSAVRDSWTEISSPTRSGYAFNGWRVVSGLGAGARYALTAGVDGVITNAATVFGAGCAKLSVLNLAAAGSTAKMTAQWVPNKYVVTLVKYNGTADSTFNVQFARNYNFDLPTWIPARPGYTFNGWWAAKYGTGEQIYTAAGMGIANTSCWSANKNWRKTANTTLYANWIPNKYTVTLVKDNGTADSSFQVQYTKDTNSDKHTWIPARCGYTFDGWWSGRYGTGEQIYTAGGMAIPDSKYWNASCGWRWPKDVSLYAKWIPKTFSITLVPGNGAANSTIPVQYSRDTNSNIAQKTPTRSGYAFGGWVTSDGVLVYDKNGLAIADSMYWNASRGWRRSGSLTVYASWTPKAGTSRLSAATASASLESGGSRTDGHLFGVLPDGSGVYDLILDDPTADETTGYVRIETEEAVVSGECQVLREGARLIVVLGEAVFVL